MKRYFYITFIFIFLIMVVVGAQEQEKKEKMASENLNNQGKELDSQISDIANRMENIIKNYSLLTTKGVKIIPYQTNYNLGADFIEIEKHLFVKDDIYNRDIVGIKKKKIKIYTNGQTISKIESEIYEKRYYSDEYDLVTIVDPSPTTPGTDDITFTHIRKGRKFIDGKKLGDIKNSTSYPVRNEIKREFLIPHLTIFNNALLYIAEAYYKSLKDVDSTMSDFLKKSLLY